MSPAQTIALLLGCLAAPTVYAFDVNAPPAELVLDGALTEWGEPTLTLGGGQHVSGEVAANANDVRARVWLAFDAEGLVVAAEVHDDAVMAGDQLQVRLASTSRRENASPAFDAHFEPVISLVAAQPSHRFAGGYRVERRIALAQLPWLMGPSLSSLAVTLTLTDVDAGERTEPTVLSTQDGGAWLLLDINPPLQVLPELGFALGNSGWAWPVAVETQRVFKQTTTGLLELDLTTATTLVDEDDAKAWVFSVDDAVPHFVLAASDHFDTFTFSCAPHAVRSLQGHRIDVPCEPERALLLTPHGSLDDQSTAMSACREQTAQCETLLFPALMAQRADMMRTPPSNEGTLPCLLAAGVFEGSGFQQGQDQRLETCFERAYGPGQLLVVDEDAFFVAHTRPPHMIWARGPGPYDRHRTEPPEPVTALTVHGNAEVTDPTVLAVLGGASTSRPLHGQPPERVVTADTLALVNGNTWSTGRRMDGPVTVVCENDVLHRRTLPLLDTGLTTAGFNATIVPFFTYKLPCDAKLVLGEHVSGAVVGTRESGRYWGGNFGSFTPDQGQFIGDVGPLHVQTNAADVAPPDWSYLPSCTLTLNGELPLLRGGACGVHFADDLNADGLLDFIITRHGEMGCGSQSLLLSNPDGWKTAGSWDWEC